MLQKLDNLEVLVVKTCVWFCEAGLFGKTPEDDSAVAKVEMLASGGSGFYLKRVGKGTEYIT